MGEKTSGGGSHMRNDKNEYNTSLHKGKPVPPLKPKTTEELLGDPKFVAFLRSIGSVSVEGLDSLELCREVRRG